MSQPNEPGIPPEYEQDVSLFPEVLRNLLFAELNAGNTIVDVGHAHPAPPVGAYIKLAKLVTTRARQSGDGLNFLERNNSQYCGEFTDGDRRFFIIEESIADSSYPNMDEIRARLEVPWVALQMDDIRSRSELPTASPQIVINEEDREALTRFEESREMNYDRWRDGTSYDIAALMRVSEPARSAIEGSLIPAKDWRDVEALVALGTPRAEEALVEASKSVDVGLRMAVMSRAPHLVADALRLASVLMALETAAIFGGLSQTLDQVEEFHPPAVIESLFRGLLHRPGDVAYHLATSLAVIYGKLSSQYDWSLRPQLLAFNTTDMTERREAFLKLYDLLKTAPTFSNTVVDQMALSLRSAQS